MDFKPYKIGKYLLLERLASGGMAEVYRAKASGAGGFEKELAVKLILPSYSNNDDFRKMFEYEARLSNKLTHANIVQIYDFVKPQDRYLLAMEFVDGKNLRQLVNKIKKSNYILPIELSVYLINEVCRGLEYAHSKKDNVTGKPLNIIHRDMSPQNIMISYEGAVKIVDFGIAKAKDRVDETRSGVIKGKFGYMSPEQANGETVDHRSDIFSTGIILWELVTGRRLFATENDLATLKLIQECVIPVPSKINPKISQELEKILLKALTKDVRLRFQTAGSFQRALQEYLNRHHSSFTSEEVSKVMHGVFLVEIQAEKKRFEAANRQSIPFSQGETQEPGRDAEGIEEVLEGEQTHSEIEVDTAITFGEDSSEVSNIEKKSPKSDSTIQKTKDSGSSTVPKTRVMKEEQNTKADPEPEARDMATKVASVEEVENSASFKESDTDVDQMPVLNQKTVVTGPEGGLLDNEEEQTTGEIAVTGSPVANLRSITPANTNKPSHTSKPLSSYTPSLQGPKHSNTSTGPSFNMDPAPSGNRLELEQTSSQAAYKGRVPVRRNDLLEPPRRRSSLVPFLLIFASIGITVYLYKILFSNQLMPTVTKMLGERAVTEAPAHSVEPLPSPPAISNGECVVRIDSDPPGAEVIINNQKKGMTSLTSSVPCNKDINLELRLKGHESRYENLFIKEKDNRVLRSLKKIPMGAVELVLSQNADVYLDGLQVGQATANQGYKVEMRAGKKHRLRLKNDLLGIDSVTEVSVQEGYSQRMVLRLEENIARRPGSKKK